MLSARLSAVSVNPSKMATFDTSFLGGSLLGRLSFRPGTVPDKPALPAGRHDLGIASERDAVLIVPDGLQPGVPVALLVMFHGAGGSAGVSAAGGAGGLQRLSLIAIAKTVLSYFDTPFAQAVHDLPRRRHIRQIEKFEKPVNPIRPVGARLRTSHAPVSAIW